MTRLPAHLALAALLSLAASWLLWKNLLKPIPPVPIGSSPARRPPPPPVVERVPGESNNAQILPSPLVLEGPFNEVIDQLRAAANLNIWVNYRAMAAGGIPRNTPVCLDVSGQELDVALESLLIQASTPDTRLNCTIRGRLVDIKAPTPPIERDSILAIYDVRPFVGRPSTHETAEARVLMNRIKTTIDPKSWDTDGNINFMGGQLVVSQNKKNQRAVASLLDQLYLRHQLEILGMRSAILLTCSLVSVTLAHLLLNLYRRKSRRSSLLCPHCGYDLRASPDICPECGQYSAHPIDQSHNAVTK